MNNTDDRDPPEHKDATVTPGTGSLTITGSAPTITVWERPPDSHSIYASIGKITAEWAFFEHVLDSTIWDLLEIPNRVGACVTAQLMGAGPRFLTLIALARHHQLPNDLIVKTRKLMEKSYALSEQRNRTIHDAWFVEKESGATGQFRAMPKKKEPAFGVEATTDAALQKIVADIRNLRDEALTLRNDLPVALAVLRGKPSAS